MYVYDRALIGARIRRARKAAGMTQEQLAERVDCGPRHIGQIERGTCGLSVEMLVNLCLALGLRTDDLLLGQYAAESDGVQELNLKLRNCAPGKRAAIQALWRRSNAWRKSRDALGWRPRKAPPL